MKKNIIIWSIGLAGLLVSWWILSLILSPDILPSPITVALVLLDSWRSSCMLAMVTIMESAMGLLLSIFISSTIVLLLAIRPQLECFIYPFIITVKASPAVSFVPIFICFVGSGPLSKVFTSAMIAFFPLVIGGIDGIKNTPAKLLILSDSYGASQFDKLTKISWPYALTGFISGLKTAAPLSVVGAVVGEYVAGGSPRGIGSYIMENSQRFFPPELFAGTILATGTGLLFFMITFYISYTVGRRFNLEKQ